MKIAVVLVITFLFACGSPGQSMNAAQTLYRAPVQMDDGLRTASPEEVGIRSGAMNALERRIAEDFLDDIGALLVLKDGCLIYERYSSNRGQDRRFTIYSVSKTFTSALIGIAMDKGYLKSVSQPALPFFPEYQGLAEDKLKNGITLEHLLTLSSGFDWDESTYSYEDSRNIHVQMEATNDWVKFILERPMRNAPGTRWVYNTGNTQLLSAIVKKTTGLFLHQFAVKYLFGPLKINDFYWNTDPQGVTCAGGSDGGLRLKSRDLAKLGCLYTNHGLWEGKRILSEAWILKSTEPHIKRPQGGEYGYLWHVSNIERNDGDHRCFFHGGSGGHLLLVVPDSSVVIVVNAFRGREFKPLLNVIFDHVME